MRAGVDGVDDSRRRFESELRGVKRELDREYGWSPRGVRWLLPVSAAVAGYLGAASLVRAVRGQRGRRREP